MVRRHCSQLTLLDVVMAIEELQTSNELITKSTTNGTSCFTFVDCCFFRLLLSPTFVSCSFVLYQLACIIRLTRIDYLVSILVPRIHYLVQVRKQHDPVVANNTKRNNMLTIDDTRNQVRNVSVTVL